MGIKSKIAKKNCWNLIFPITTGQISTKLGTKQPWIKRILDVQMKVQPSPQDGITEIAKIHWRHFKNQWANFPKTWNIASLGKGYSYLLHCPRRANKDFKPTCLYNHSFTEDCLLLGNVSQVSNVAHGPLVIVFR